MEETPVEEAARQLKWWQEALPLRVQHQYGLGVPIAELARQAGVARSTVYQWIWQDRRRRDMT